jgi:hypothetical protein
MRVRRGTLVGFGVALLLPALLTACAGKVRLSAKTMCADPLPAVAHHAMDRGVRPVNSIGYRSRLDRLLPPSGRQNPRRSSIEVPWTDVDGVPRRRRCRLREMAGAAWRGRS